MPCGYGPARGLGRSGIARAWRSARPQGPFVGGPWGLVACLPTRYASRSMQRIFFKKFAEFPLTFRPLFWPGNEGAQFPFKITQFSSISPHFLSKSPQKARKIVNIRKSLCHHLNPLLHKHLTPLFSESPISPCVHSRSLKSPFSAQKSSFARP